MGRSTKIIGEKLKKRREALALTQGQLGQMIDGRMTDENIGRIERGDNQGILTKHLPKLAAALQMSLEDLKRDMVPANGQVTAKLDVDLLWGRLFAAAQELAVINKKTRLQILTEAVRRESMPSKMRLIAKQVPPDR